MSQYDVPEKLRRDPGERLPGCKLEPAVMALLKKNPFYGIFIQKLRRVITDEVPTLGVGGVGDDIVLFVNPYFWNHFEQRLLHQIALLKHECHHLIHEHLFRRGDRDEKIWNVAADMAINPKIPNLPDGGCYPADFNLPDGMTAEWYYDNLPKNASRSGGGGEEGEGQGGAQGQNQSQGGGQGQNQSQDPGQQPGQGGGQDQQQGQGQPQQGQNGGGGGTQPFPDSWPDYHGKWGCQNLLDSTDEFIRSKLKKMVNDSLDEAMKQAGTVPGDLINEIQKAQHKVQPWKRILRQFLTFATLQQRTVSRRRPNRRLGIYFPGKTVETRLKVLVGYDVSGSESDEAVAQFFEEMDSISQHAEIIGAEFDTELKKPPFEHKKGYRPPRHGYGGTDITVPFRLNEEGWEFVGRVATDKGEDIVQKTIKPIKADCVIVFTDGYGPIPDPKPKYPVLWVYNKGHRPAPWGRKIVLEVN